MNLNKKPLLLAITVGMGLVPLAGAFAAGPLNDLSSGTTPNPISIPSEAKEESSEYFTVYDAAATTGTAVNAGGDMDAYIYTMPGYIVKKTEQKNLIVKVALTGGAKFTKVPVLVCAHSGTDGAGAGQSNDLTTKGISAAMWADVLPSTDYNVAGGPTLADTEWEAGGTTAIAITPTVQSVNVASYSYSFPDGFNVAKESSGACILSFSATEPYGGAALTTPAISVMKGSAGAEIDMTVEVSYNDFFGVQTKRSTIPVIRFTTAYKAEFYGTNGPDENTAAAPMIDVGVLSKRFKENNVNVNEVFAGYVVITAAASDMRGADGVGVSALDLIDSATLTFSGPTLATLSKVTLHLPSDVEANGCKATVQLSGQISAGTGGTASDVISIPINTNDAYSAFISSATVANEASGFAVCLVGDGIKTMAPGYVGLTVNVTSPGNKVTELAASPDFVEVQRNGTVVRVLNVPGKSSDPYQVNVRMFNVSNSEIGNIKGTLYGIDGKEIATDILLADKLASNNMKLLKSADLVKLAGKEWEGRAWLLIQAPVSSDSFKVQVLMKNPTGELANLSTDAAD